MKTSAARLQTLIAQALPPLSAHPRTAVRAALAQGQLGAEVLFVRAVPACFCCFVAASSTLSLLSLPSSHANSLKHGVINILVRVYKAAAFPGQMSGV